MTRGESRVFNRHHLQGSQVSDARPGPPHLFWIPPSFRDWIKAGNLQFRGSLPGMFSTELCCCFSYRGRTITPHGPEPAFTFLVTVLVARSTTEMLFEGPLAE
jgi:hypothetical protein